LEIVEIDSDSKGFKNPATKEWILFNMKRNLIYQGFLSPSNEFHGKGKIYYKNGILFEGELVNGFPIGEGQLIVCGDYEAEEDNKDLVLNATWENGILSNDDFDAIDSFWKDTAASVGLL